MPRLQFKIMWLMVAVAALAFVLALPAAAQFLLMLAAIPAAMILLPTALAPHPRRVEVAYWAIALHPLAFLAWLSLWRFVLDPRTLLPRDRGSYFILTLEVPYLLALLTRWYLLLLLAIAGPLATGRFAGRPLAVPLLLLVVVWFSTWAVLDWDPFKVMDWFWD